MKELHDLFVDIFMLVEEQGVFIDHIQTNVERTQDYVDVTNEKFKLAARYKKKNPLRQLCCCCCPPWRCCLWNKTPLHVYSRSISQFTSAKEQPPSDVTTMEMKVTAVQLLLVNRGMGKSNSAEHRKQLGGSWNWHLSGSFRWRGCEAAAIERDSSVRATGRRGCLLETFIRQRSQTRRAGEQRLCHRHHEDACLYSFCLRESPRRPVIGKTASAL